MKKYLFLIPLILLFSTFYFVEVHASINYPDGSYILIGGAGGSYRGYNCPGDMKYSLSGTTLTLYGSLIYEYDFGTDPNVIPTRDEIQNGTLLSIYTSSTTRYYVPAVSVILFTGNLVNIGSNPIDIYQYPSDDPPDPEPGDSWLSDMWEWFLWQLGINDDYSGDIDEFITGGDRVHLTLVTPTPSPTPTPRPSPTPYVLDIVDPNTGQPVYTITGIPGNYTYNYYEGDTSNGSDFDIFEVDLQVGDGGSSNPRDGLNDVMKTNNDYLEDLDITPVSGSFSVLPSDWYLLIGVLISFPVIAGFISKLLK